MRVRNKVELGAKFGEDEHLAREKRPISLQEGMAGKAFVWRRDGQQRLQIQPWKILPSNHQSISTEDSF